MSAIFREKNVGRMMTIIKNSPDKKFSEKEEKIWPHSFISSAKPLIFAQNLGEV